MEEDVEMVDKIDKSIKVNGIYYNYPPEMPVGKFEVIKDVTLVTGYEMLGKFQQSLHHVNIYYDKNGKLGGINMRFRPAGIKPEDIDGNFLNIKNNVLKKLSKYEKLLFELYQMNEHMNFDTSIPAPSKKARKKRQILK